MTCFTRCGSLCCPNTPCPIFIYGNCDEGNSIINPTVGLSFGFFENNSGGTVASGAVVPLAASQTRGAKITSSSSGGVVLTPGEYEISYTFDATLPASGALSIALRENSMAIMGSTASASGTSGNVVTLTKSMMLNIPSTTTIELYNASGESITYQNANLLVKEI